MAEYIEKNELISKINDEILNYSKTDTNADKAIISIANCLKSFIAMQTGHTDVQPVRCGEWEIIFPQNGKPKLKCTNCHSLFDIRTNDKHTCIYPKFCEECGADMRGDTE